MRHRSDGSDCSVGHDISSAQALPPDVGGSVSSSVTLRRRTTSSSISRHWMRARRTTTRPMATAPTATAQSAMAPSTSEPTANVPTAREPTALAPTRTMLWDRGRIRVWFSIAASGRNGRLLARQRTPPSPEATFADRVGSWAIIRCGAWSGHSFMASDRRQSTLGWNDGRTTLHGTHASCDVIPDLITVAGVETKQLQNADKLKVNGIAIGVRVVLLCSATSPLGLSKCGLTMRGRKRDNALFTGSSNARRTVHHDTKLKQKLRGVSATLLFLLGVVLLGFHVCVRCGLTCGLTSLSASATRALVP